MESNRSGAFVVICSCSADQCEVYWFRGVCLSGPWQPISANRERSHL